VPAIVVPTRRATANPNSLPPTSCESAEKTVDSLENAPLSAARIIVRATTNEMTSTTARALTRATARRVWRLRFSAARGMEVLRSVSGVRSGTSVGEVCGRTRTCEAEPDRARCVLAEGAEGADTDVV